MHIGRVLSRLAPKTPFGKGVLSLTRGTVIGQLLLLAASPFLTRLYSVDDFGAFGVLTSLLSIIAVVASLRYQLAIPIPKEDRKASNLVVLSFLILLVVSTVVAVIAYVAGEWIAAWTNTPAIESLLWFLPIGVFLVGSYQILNYWALRQKAFDSIGLGKAFQGGARGVSQMAIGAVTAGPAGLMVGYILGQLSGGAILAHAIWKRRNDVSHGISYRSVRNVAGEFRRFPLYSVWSGVFNKLSSQLPILLFASFFGLAVAGFYSLTRQVLSAPLQLIGQAIAQAFLSEAPEAARMGTLRHLTSGIFKRLVKLAVPVCLVLGIAAPEIFSLVFGAQWRISGIYCQWLTPWLFFVFVSSPLSMVPSIMEKQRPEMIFHGSLLVLRTAAILAGAMLQSATLAIALFSVISTIYWLIFMLWNMRLSGNRITHALGIIVRELWTAVLFVLPLVACKLFFQCDLYIVGAAVLTSGLLAVRMLYSFRRA